MKGTRPRHPDPVNDADIVRELLESEKDRAENTMIVDMVRNDLGRIGDTGSLMTTALHTVESFSTVHQLTSTVEVQTDAGLFDVFAATFPGASITGAPKVNTAGFIADLERTPRGLYTGTIGAIPPDGDFEFNIAIRTAWVNTNLGRATYGVGGVSYGTPTRPPSGTRHTTRLACCTGRTDRSGCSSRSPGLRSADRCCSNGTSTGFRRGHPLRVRCRPRRGPAHDRVVQRR